MDYLSCYMPQCPRREQCTLWHNAITYMDEGATMLQVTSPRIIEEAGGFDHCPHYYEWRLRRFARGMQWRYGALTGDQQDAIQRELKMRFGYSLVGRMRRGDEVISPEQQEEIRAIFARHSDTVEPHFESFEMHYIKPPRRQ